MEPVSGLAADRPVILYDQLGCGLSDRPGDRSLWTLAYYIEELETVRKALGLSECHILGQSWGTMLAVDYMLERKPAGVKSLVMSGPCLSASRWHDDCRRLISGMKEKDRNAILQGEASGDFDSAAYKKAAFRFYRKHTCRLFIWPPCALKTFGNVGTDIYRYMWGPSEFTITGTLKDYERADRLKELNVRVLYTCGRHDYAAPETCVYYRDMTPGSALVIFEGASHMHHVEKTREYLAATGAFIAKTDAGQKGTENA
jgi:proline iminopeptidase